MPRALPARRSLRPMPHRLHRAHGAAAGPPRLSDLVLALLAVVLLGGLALAAAFALTVGVAAP